MSDRPQRERIMLAYLIETDKRVSRLGEHFIAQPKLNGDRCWVDWFHGDPVLISSYGNMFTGLGHINEAIKKLGPVLYLDGELYKHGWDKDRIHSAVSRKTTKSEDAPHIEFHIFDVKATLPQWTRIGMLDDVTFSGPLVRVPTYIAKIENWRNLTAQFVNDGYEGIILRSLDAIYEEKRSVTMLKYKPTYVDRYEILDIKEAISIEGEPKDMLGSFFVASPTAKKDGFWVGAGRLPHVERKRLWKKGPELIGKILKVKHEKLTTANGVPNCCVAVSVEE